MHQNAWTFQTDVESNEWHMQLQRCQCQSSFGFPNNQCFVVAARNSCCSVCGYFNACHLCQMAGQRVQLFARVNVPHNQIAIFWSGNHLCFIGNRHGDTCNSITVADKHLSQFTAGGLPHFQRHIPWTGDYKQWIDGDNETSDFGRMRYRIIFVFTCQRPYF